MAGRFDGFWLFVVVGALLISIVGYYLAYQGIFRVEDGPRLSGPQIRAVVAAGFGGFLAHGGGALDQYALEAAGAKEANAKARVAALGGMEHGGLAIGGCAAAIILLASGRGQPPLDFTLPGLFVGFATGMLFTRRTGPLAGAGVLALALPLTIWVSGAPFAVAIVGVFVYRVLALLLPMPVSLAALPTLRKLAEDRKSPRERRLNPRCALGTARSMIPSPIGSACSGGAGNKAPTAVT